MFEDLTIIHWPDPRLLRMSKPVETFDENLHVLAHRMLALMREQRGVGLAAPQVGQNIRLFVMNATGQPADDRIYINPILSDPAGDEEGEEGCLSLPGIHVKVIRSRDMRITARDLEGGSFEERASGYIARIWQHEFDHLNGTLLIDRMGPVARMANRRILKELQAEYERQHSSPIRKAPKP